MKIDKFSAASELDPILIAVNVKLCTNLVRVNKIFCPNWISGRTKLRVQYLSIKRINDLMNL